MFTYSGHSSFTLRWISDAASLTSNTTKYVSNLQITSEQCDEEIQNGLPTTDTFSINEYSYFIECLNGNNDLCQVYRQFTQTFNLKNISINTTNITSNAQSRRRMQFGFGGSNAFAFAGGSPYSPSPPSWWTGCFPSDTTVNTTNGDKKILDLNIGDQVLTINGYTGNLEYSEIYMIGHKLKDILAEFITLYTNNDNFTISATHGHLVYVCGDIDCNWNNAILKKFGKVKVNKDYIFDYDMNKYLVVRKEIETMKGFYNPFTLNGNIIVNNMISSCHTQWILDEFFDEKYESYLPGLYQVLFAPIRWIYSWNPTALRLFDSLYPNGVSDVKYVNVFEIIKQTYWCLFVQSS